ARRQAFYVASVLRHTTLDSRLRGNDETPFTYRLKLQCDPAATALHRQVVMDPERGARGRALPASAASFPVNARAVSRSARRARPKDRVFPAAAYLPLRAIPRGARRIRSATSA